MRSHAGLCFCCSGIAFSECCEPILRDRLLAGTPLALMRSRYTAYVLGNEKYLLDSWAPATRPQALSLKENRVKWLGLTIHSAETVLPADSVGRVDFSARFIEGDQLCVLRENSSFIRENGFWFYLDGSCDITKTKIGRNAACPCGSGKKSKRCCLAG